MTTWDIWVEGYAATGQTGSHQMMAKGVEADTFKEAVIKFSKTEEAEGYGHFNEERPTFWGCRVFDNHKDASKSFG